VVTVTFRTINGELSYQQLKVYPNPVTDHLWITGIEAVETIRIFTLTGQLVYEQTGVDKTIQVETGNWTKGCYVVQLQSGRRLLTQKFTKQ